LSGAGRAVRHPYVPKSGDGCYFARVDLATKPPPIQSRAPRATPRASATRKNTLRHAVLTPSALSAAASECHAVANGRDTPDS